MFGRLGRFKHKAWRPAGEALTPQPRGVGAPPTRQKAWALGLGAWSLGLSSLAAAARKAGGHALAQGFQARTLAHHLQQGVALQRGRHHVAAQGHDGVVELAVQHLQLGEPGTQAVEVLQVALRFGQVQVRRQQLAVLVERDQGLAAERLGLGTPRRPRCGCAPGSGVRAGSCWRRCARPWPAFACPRRPASLHATSRRHAPRPWT
jgi:hypothetical protein